MDEDTLKKLNDNQSLDDTVNNSNEQTQPEKPKSNYSFMTPSEAGYRETDPNKINAAPRPQPGMTFTPTGGSVSGINHQLNKQKEEPGDNQPQQTETHQ